MKIPAKTSTDALKMVSYSRLKWKRRFSAADKLSPRSSEEMCDECEIKKNPRINESGDLKEKRDPEVRFKSTLL